MTTKAISASNASHSSAATALVTACSVSASLTIAMISARRDASMKRRRIASYSPAVGSAECDDHHGMVSVSLRPAHASDLSMGVETGQRRRFGSKRVDERLGLARERLAVHGKRPLAACAVEDDRGARRRTVQLPDCVGHAIPRRDDDALGLL